MGWRVMKSNKRARRRRRIGLVIYCVSNVSLFGGPCDVTENVSGGSRRKWIIWFVHDAYAIAEGLGSGRAS